MGTRAWPTGIRPWGNGIQIRIFRHGKEITETVDGDPYNARDLASAIKRRDALKARLKLGLPLYADDPEAKLQFFADAAQEYMNTLDAAATTHLSYEAVLNGYWIPAFGSWPVSEISPNAIKTELGKRSISISTKRRVVVPLKGVLDHAGIIPNPAAGIVKGRSQKHEVERYTPDERQTLLDNLDGQARVYFALLFGCGLRPGEALAARWEDYDGESIWIHQTRTKRLLKASTKTYKRRQVYIPTWLRPILNGHDTRHRADWIFLKYGNAPYMSAEVFNKSWTRAHKKAGIHWRVPYVCRHTRAAELLSQAVEPGEAAKQMGHSLKMFIDTYAEWIEEFSTNRDMSRLEGIAVSTSDWTPDKNRTKPNTGKAKVLKFQSNSK